VHAAGAAESIWQVMVAAPVTLNWNTAFALVEGSDGYEVSATIGGAVSTVQLAVFVAVLPAASEPRSVNVCEPSASPEYETEVEHAAGVPLSSWQVTVVAPVALNEICAEVMFVVPDGAEVIDSDGGVVSTVQV
jgi:hypothetical protein